MWLNLRHFIFAFVLLLPACADRSFTPVVPEALNVGKPVSLFVATTRQRDANGSFGSERSENLTFLEAVVSVPPNHQIGELDFGYANPNPKHQFTLAGQSELTTNVDFKSQLRAKLAKLPPAEREVTVFVHGYNSTHAETVFRAAQLKHDIQVPGVLVVYSWPSTGKALAYAYDTDSVLFARDGMETLLRQVADVGANRVLVVAHSMGGAVTMETLRQIDLASPGWPKRNLSAVVLVSPDLDVQVFRSQVLGMSAVPNPFVVFVSTKDAVLSLSSRLRGTTSQNRLGSIDRVDRIADLPIDIIDTTAFSNKAGSSHFVPATSPALIAMIQKARSVSEMFDTDETSLGAILTGRPATQQTAKEFVIGPGGTSPR